jgi:hypothetical protein
MGDRAKSLLDSVMFNKFHYKTNLTTLLSGILGSKNKTKYSEFLNAGSPQDTLNVEILKILRRFSWPENGFIVYQGYDLVKKKCCHIYHRMKFLEQNIESKLLLGSCRSCMGHSAKSLFYSVLFNKFHQKTKLMTLFSCNGQLASKKKFSFFGLILFVSEKNTFVEQFFSIRALFRRENSI